MKKIGTGIIFLEQLQKVSQRGKTLNFKHTKKNTNHFNFKVKKLR